VAGEWLLTKDTNSNMINLPKGAGKEYIWKLFDIFLIGTNTDTKIIEIFKDDKSVNKAILGANTLITNKRQYQEAPLYLNEGAKLQFKQTA